MKINIQTFCFLFIVIVNILTINGISNYIDTESEEETEFHNIINAEIRDSKILSFDYETIENITITSNDDLLNKATAYGWNGTGLNSDDPIIIANYLINSSENILIDISNVTKHISVQNNYLVKVNQLSINLEGVENCQIKETILCNNIRINNSKRITISKNNITNIVNESCIKVNNSETINILNNTITNNIANGILVNSVINTIIAYNEIINNSLNGIVLKKCSDVIINHNSISNNNKAVICNASEYIIVFKNIIEENYNIAIDINETYQATIGHNNISNNANYAFLFNNCIYYNANWNNVINNSQETTAQYCVINPDQYKRYNIKLNYWDDWADTIDANNDGILDEVYYDDYLPTKYPNYLGKIIISELYQPENMGNNPILNGTVYLSFSGRADTYTYGTGEEYPYVFYRYPNITWYYSVNGTNDWQLLNEDTLWGIYWNTTLLNNGHYKLKVSTIEIGGNVVEYAFKEVFTINNSFYDNESSNSSSSSETNGEYSSISTEFSIFAILVLSVVFLRKRKYD